MKFNRIAICSGTSTDPGKTTIAKHLKTYLLENGAEDVKHIGVENRDKEMDCEDARIHPEKPELRQLVVSLATVKPENAIIVDVGGDHFNPLLDTMAEMNGLVEKHIDAFLFVVSPSIKPANVLRGIKNFAERGVKPSAIHLVFNRVEDERQASQIPADYEDVFKEAKKIGFKIVPEPIYSNDSVKAMRKIGTVFNQISGDDFTAKIAEANAAGDDARAEELANMMIDSSLATLPANNFRLVFDSLLK